MAGTNVKLGVEYSQFKQGMKESSAAVKTLEQALKLNEAQLKQNGNEELVLQNRTKILTDQIEAQKNVVTQAENALRLMNEKGVEKTSVEFQKMQKEVYKAETDLLNMQSELDGVGEAGEEAQSGVSHMNQALQRIGTNVSVDSVLNGIGKITDGLEAAAQKAVQLGKKLVSAMLSGGQWADDLQTTADKWGMDPETVYRMQQTANLIDTTAETIYSAKKKMITGMGKESDKEVMGAFAHFDITNLEGTAENIENVFWAVGEGLMRETDLVNQNEYAMRIFGKSWDELIPIFKAGRAEYEKTMDSWTWVGDEQFKNLTELNDAEMKLTTEWEAFQHNFEAALAPAMTTVMETLQGLLTEFNTYLQSEDGQKMMESLGEAVSSLVSDLAKIDPEEAVANLQGVINAIREGLEWIKEHHQEVVTAVEAIFIGWGALKLTGGALEILKLINGIQGLTGAGTAAAAAGEAAGASWASGFAGAAAIAIKAIPWLAGLLMLTDTSNHGSNDITMPDLVRQANEGDEYATELFTGLHNRYGMSIEDAASAEGLAEALAMGYTNMQELYSNLENLFGWEPYKEKNDMGKLYDNGGDQPKAMTDDVIHKDRRTGEILTQELPNSMDRMTEVAGEMNTAIDASSKSSAEMTAAATGLLDLPALIQSAVIQGMSAVSIVVDASGIDAMQPRISNSIFDKILQMTK